MGVNPTREYVAMREVALSAAWCVGLRDRARRDEVAQEVLLRAWACGVMLKPARVRDAWVRTVSMRCATDVLRRWRRESRARLDVGVLQGAGDAGLSEERVDARRRLRDVLSRARGMCPSLRAVFDAVMCEGRAIEDVASELGVSRAVVDTRLRRARARLAAQADGGRVSRGRASSGASACAGSARARARGAARSTRR